MKVRRSKNKNKKKIDLKKLELTLKNFYNKARAAKVAELESNQKLISTSAELARILCKDSISTIILQQNSTLHDGIH